MAGLFQSGAVSDSGWGGQAALNRGCCRDAISGIVMDHMAAFSFKSALKTLLQNLLLCNFIL